MRYECDCEHNYECNQPAHTPTNRLAYASSSSSLLPSPPSPPPSSSTLLQAHVHLCSFITVMSSLGAPRQANIITDGRMDDPEGTRGPRTLPGRLLCCCAASLSRHPTVSPFRRILHASGLRQLSVTRIRVGESHYHSREGRRSRRGGEGRKGEDWSTRRKSKEDGRRRRIEGGGRWRPEKAC
jgi:hypothetical protein